MTRTREPAPPFTCGGCSSTWTGVSRAHCSGCHLTWSSVSLFDRHRRYSTCHAPGDILERGEPLRLVGGIWFPPEADEETKARMLAARS